MHLSLSSFQSRSSFIQSDRFFHPHSRSALFTILTLQSHLISPRLCVLCCQYLTCQYPTCVTAARQTLLEARRQVSWRRAQKFDEKARALEEQAAALPPNEGKGAIHLLCFASDDDVGEVEGVLDALLSKVGASVDVRDASRQTLLHRATRKDRYNLVDALLRRGADVNGKVPMVGDSFLLDTPLVVAVAKGHAGIARLLLKSGADVNAVDSRRGTALHTASFMGHEVVSALLVENGASLEARDDWGSTPVQLACDQGHPSVVRLLRDAGARLEARDNYMLTPLHSAAGCNSTCASVWVLLRSGVEVDPTDQHDATPLVAAAFSGHPASVWALLEAEADPFGADAAHTPLQHSVLREDGSAEHARIMLECGVEMST